MLTDSLASTKTMTFTNIFSNMKLNSSSALMGYLTQCVYDCFLPYYFSNSHLVLSPSRFLYNSLVCCLLVFLFVLCHSLLSALLQLLFLLEISWEWQWLTQTFHRISWCQNYENLFLMVFFHYSLYKMLKQYLKECCFLLFFLASSPISADHWFLLSQDSNMDSVHSGSCRSFDCHLIRAPIAFICFHSKSSF